MCCGFVDIDDSMDLADKSQSVNQHEPQFAIIHQSGINCDRRIILWCRLLNELSADGESNDSF